MLTRKALAMMAIFTAVMISMFNFVGFPEHYGNLLWSLGAAAMLVITLVGNVWIFIAVAQDEPWQWGSEED